MRKCDVKESCEYRSPLFCWSQLSLAECNPGFHFGLLAARARMIRLTAVGALLLLAEALPSGYLSFVIPPSRLRKKPFVDPISHVVIKVLHCVRILSRIRFTRDAGRLPVSRAFYNHKILITAPRKLIMNLIVPDKIMCSHRGHQKRRPDRWQMTGRRVITGTIVNSIHRIGRPNRPRA